MRKTVVMTYILSSNSTDGRLYHLMVDNVFYVFYIKFEGCYYWFYLFLVCFRYFLS